MLQIAESPTRRLHTQVHVGDCHCGGIASRCKVTRRRLHRFKKSTCVTSPDKLREDAGE